MTKHQKLEELRNKKAHKYTQDLSEIISTVNGMAPVGISGDVSEMTKSIAKHAYSEGFDNGSTETIKHVIEIAEGMERKQLMADYEGHYNRALTELKEKLEGMLEGNKK